MYPCFPGDNIYLFRPEKVLRPDYPIRADGFLRFPFFPGRCPGLKYARPSGRKHKKKMIHCNHEIPACAGMTREITGAGFE